MIVSRRNAQPALELCDSVVLGVADRMQLRLIDGDRDARVETVMDFLPEPPDGHREERTPGREPRSPSAGISSAKLSTSTALASPNPTSPLLSTSTAAKAIHATR